MPDCCCHIQVDVDLSPEQFAAKVSRQQARLYLRHDGTFRLTNTGRRKFLVNNCQVRPLSQTLKHHASLSAALGKAGCRGVLASTYHASKGAP